MFLGAVVLVAAAALLITPALRRARRPTRAERADAGHHASRLVWAAVGAIAVLALELLGSEPGTALPAVLALVLRGRLALRRLLPPGTLVGRRGLPAVIGTRGLMSAAFFCAEAYIVFVLQERWGLTPGRAGLALTFVGVTWAVVQPAPGPARRPGLRT